MFSSQSAMWWGRLVATAASHQKTLSAIAARPRRRVATLQGLFPFTRRPQSPAAFERCLRDSLKSGDVDLAQLIFLSMLSCRYRPSVGVVGRLLAMALDRNDVTGALRIYQSVRFFFIMHTSTFLYSFSDAQCIYKVFFL
jgi:hypothetical protein